MREGNIPAGQDIRKWCRATDSKEGETRASRLETSARTQGNAPEPAPTRDTQGVENLTAKEWNLTNVTNDRKGREGGQKLGESEGNQGANPSAPMEGGTGINTSPELPRDLPGDPGAG